MANRGDGERVPTFMRRIFQSRDHNRSSSSGPFRASSPGSHLSLGERKEISKKGTSGLQHHLRTIPNVERYTKMIIITRLREPLQNTHVLPPICLGLLLCHNPAALCFPRPASHFHTFSSCGVFLCVHHLAPHSFNQFSGQFAHERIIHRVTNPCRLLRRDVTRRYKGTDVRVDEEERNDGEAPVLGSISEAEGGELGLVNVREGDGREPGAGGGGMCIGRGREVQGQSGWGNRYRTHVLLASVTIIQTPCAESRPSVSCNELARVGYGHPEMERWCCYVLLS